MCILEELADESYSCYVSKHSPKLEFEKDKLEVIPIADDSNISAEPNTFSRKWHRRKCPVTICRYPPKTVLCRRGRRTVNGGRRVRLNRRGNFKVVVLNPLVLRKGCGWNNNWHCQAKRERERRRTSVRSWARRAPWHASRIRKKIFWLMVPPQDTVRGLHRAKSNRWILQHWTAKRKPQFKQ